MQIDLVIKKKSLFLQPKPTTMGTNYYALRIPTAEERQALSELALVGNITALSDAIGNFERVHIGKSSVGWQFLFNLNGKRFYATKAELEKWLGGVEITNEYGEKFSIGEFWQIVNSKLNQKRHKQGQYESHYIEIDDFEFIDGEFC